MLTVRLDSPTPLTEQVFLGIRRGIAAGELNPGDELPTVRQLAADLGINLNTVARAYRALEQAGLVRSVRGRGTQVTASAEVVRGSAKEARQRVAARLRDALADAKLAGLDRREVDELLERMVGEYWQAKSALLIGLGDSDSGRPHQPEAPARSIRSSPTLRVGIDGEKCGPDET